VLAVVGTGDDLQQARAQAYAGISKIELAGSFYRRDIAAAAAHQGVLA
jgi:phosphoribosylamine--glycine ligase